MTDGQKQCERCGRVRSVKHLEQAVYVRQNVTNHWVTVVGEANTFRCVARASCKQEARRRGPLLPLALRFAGEGPQVIPTPKVDGRRRLVPGPDNRLVVQRVCQIPDCGCDGTWHA